MEVRATAKYVRVQPRKVRIIADEVRGANAVKTAAVLQYHRSKSAKALRKVLISAMANAAENHGLSAEELRIASINIDEGPRLKRMRARAQGRGNRILKKTSHITVVVEDFEIVAPVKPHGTKPKPRPTFGVKAKRGAKVTPSAEAPKAATVVEEVAPIVVEEAPVAAPEPTEAVAAETPVAETPAAEKTATEATTEPAADAAAPKETE